MIYFSALTGGFYRHEDKESYVAAGSWPDDAVELTVYEQQAYWMATPPAGKQIGSVLGRPVWEAALLADPQVRINSQSLAYLAETDWYVIRQLETGEAIPAEVLEKRQAARKAVVR